MTNVLLCDDDSWALRGLEHVLSEAQGFTVVGSARQGEDAVALAGQLRPDIVLMDISMPPGISGITATAQIRANNPNQTVVALTTTASGPGIRHMLESGAVAVMNKSLPPERFVDVLTHIVHDEPARYLATLREDLILTRPDPSVPLTEKLTQKEEEILLFLCDGLTYADIAKSEHCSVATVRTHAERLRTKLHAQSVSQLILRAIQHKIYIPK